MTPLTGPGRLLAALLILGAAVAGETAVREGAAELKDRARRAAERGDAGEALRVYQEVLRVSPRDMDSRLHVAELHAWMHDLDRSITAYQDLLALDPANLRAQMGLARVLRWSHRYPEAERLYSARLEAAPGDMEAIEGLAQTYALAGDYPESLALIDRGLAKTGQDAELLALKGTVLAWQGRFDEGIAWLQKALAVNPRSADVLRGLGNVYAWKRDHVRAVGSFRRALELDPTSVDAALDLASAYAAQGRVDQAEHTIIEALRWAPEDRRAIQMLQRLRFGNRWNLARVWRAGLEAATHAGVPLAVALLMYRRRRFVRRLPRLYRFAYRAGLPAVSLAWIAAFAAQHFGGDGIAMSMTEPLVFVALGLAVSSPFWEKGEPVIDPASSAVLAVGAHPDDIELGAGGLMLRLRAEGRKVYGLVMSQGEKGAPAEARRAEEAHAAARVLGLAGLWVLDLPDTGLRQHIPEMRRAVEEKIRELGIGLVVTHSFREIHGDHVAVFEAAKEAARRCSLMCFETVSTPPEFVPNYFVDITEFVDDKLRAVAQHRSQGGKTSLDPEAVRGRAAHRGLQVGVPSAEAFWVYRWVR